MKLKWKDTPLLYKIVVIISIFASLSVIILEALQIFDIWNQEIHITVPLLGVITLCLAYLQWNVNRKVAYFSIGAALFIFMCAIAVLFII